MFRFQLIDDATNVKVRLWAWRSRNYKKLIIRQKLLSKHLIYKLLFYFNLIDNATIRKIISCTTQYVWSHIYIKRYFPIWKMTFMICNQLSVGNFNRLSLWCASISLLLPLPLISSSNASVATVFFLQISYVHTSLLTWKSCQDLVVHIAQLLNISYGS